MSKIVWTKEYVVSCSEGNFKLYVSEHGNGDYHASVLYYRKSGSWAKGEHIVIDLMMERFIDSSEQGVFQEAVQWIKQTLDPNAGINPAKT